MGFSIGKVNVENRLVLAPMADITDVSFRILCRKLGAGLVFNEMLNANAICRRNKATLQKLAIAQEEHPVAVQLFGAQVGLLVSAAKKAVEMGADIIDLNMGCPYEKILSQGAGAALLKRPSKVSEIIHALKKNIGVPVTAKIRTEKNFLELAKLIEDAGADAISVHARTVAQGYSGAADWDKIKDVKKILKIPVIGSGDAFSAEKARGMLVLTGCDAVMIGRGCIGNPHIFSEATDAIDGIKPKKLQWDKRLSLFWDYVKLSKKFGTFRFATAKRHAIAFTKSVPCSAGLRAKISKATDIEDVRRIYDSFIEEMCHD